MTNVRGRFDGQKIVLLEPVPAGIAVPTDVTVVFENGDAQALLDEIGKLAVSTDALPTDYAAQHEHHVKRMHRNW